ncbi:hypothetical protein IF1G_02756 [Cordyceps javanica]|uniref:Uncharacterized protein n=1 Tax=Cordyceps javanica TaxID=43265 RepID=A0A545VAB7_9HYPO|nr:hypothetical protein IF1G_02756 [Cordyceps javanica]
MRLLSSVARALCCKYIAGNPKSNSGRNSYDNSKAAAGQPASHQVAEKKFHLPRPPESPPKSCCVIGARFHHCHEGYYQ